ncbi:MAG: hypothetical protein R3E32_21960 [Chitinophagales bacterium]
MRHSEIIQLLQEHPDKLLQSTGFERLVAGVVGKYVEAKRLPANQKKEIVEKAKKKVLKQLMKLAQKDKLKAALPTLIVELTNNLCSDIEDRWMLQNFAPQLIAKYEYLVAAMVQKYVREGSIEDKDSDQFIENVQGRLMEKLADNKLAEQFKGNSLFKTYFYRVAYNAVVDEYRKYVRRPSTNELRAEVIEQKVHSSVEVESDSIDLYGHILRTLPKQARRKFEMTAKVVYRMILIVKDIKIPYPYCADDLLVEILSEFGKDYTDLAKGTLWEMLNHFVAALEEEKEGSVRTLKNHFQQIQLFVLQNIFRRKITIESTAQKQAADEYLENLVYRFYR